MSLMYPSFCQLFQTQVPNFEKLDNVKFKLKLDIEYVDRSDTNSGINNVCRLTHNHTFDYMLITELPLDTILEITNFLTLSQLLNLFSISKTFIKQYRQLWRTRFCNTFVPITEINFPVYNYMNILVVDEIEICKIHYSKWCGHSFCDVTKYPHSFSKKIGYNVLLGNINFNSSLISNVSYDLDSRILKKYKYYGHWYIYSKYKSENYDSNLFRLNQIIDIVISENRLEDYRYLMLSYNDRLTYGKNLFETTSNNISELTSPRRLFEALRCESYDIVHLILDFYDDSINVKSEDIKRSLDLTNLSSILKKDRDLFYKIMGHSIMTFELKLFVLVNITFATSDHDKIDIIDELLSTIELDNIDPDQKNSILRILTKNPEKWVKYFNMFGNQHKIFYLSKISNMKYILTNENINIIDHYDFNDQHYLILRRVSRLFEDGSYGPCTPKIKYELNEIIRTLSYSNLKNLFSWSCKNGSFPYIKAIHQHSQKDNKFSITRKFLLHTAQYAIANKYTNIINYIDKHMI